MADLIQIEKEKALISRCIQGDKIAGDELVNKYAKLIYNSFYETFKEKCWIIKTERVDELFREFFVRLYDKECGRLKQFSGRNNASLASWLAQVARNFTIDFIRKESIKAKIKITSLDKICTEEQRERHPQLTVQPEAKKKLAFEDLEKYVMQAVERLPKDERHLIDLLFFHKVSHNTLASQLGKSVDALYMQKKRILGKLHEYLLKTVGKEEVFRLLREKAGDRYGFRKMV